LKVCIDEFGRLSVCEGGYVVYECPEELECEEHEKELDDLAKVVKAGTPTAINEMLNIEKLVVCCILSHVLKKG